MTNDKPLTKKAIEQLKSLARGNNIKPEKIELIESDENVYELSAQITLEPNIDIKIKKGVGRPRSKKHKLLGSFQALTTEIENEKKAFQKKQDWIDLSVKELESELGHGWGHNGATLFWDKQETLLTAHENCPTCRGSGQSPCPTCQGLGTQHCAQCDGRGQEPCILCQGIGQDPNNPSNPCPTCHGTRFSPCRFCQPISGILGRTLCEQCAGKGNLPCLDCQSTGFHSQEAKIKKCAVISFALGETIKIPSGLLRLIQRVGDINLPRHAKITMKRANVEQGENPALIHLSAHIPYADMKVRINGKGRLISVFGEKAKLAGVPYFLDDALEKSRILLIKVAKGEETLEKAMITRALQDALMLVLQGKTHPNELRRRYPVGLSANAAKEIMGNVALAIRNQTRKTRLVIGAVYAVLATVFYASLFLTSLFSTITQGWSALFVNVSLLVLALVASGGGWFFLRHAARYVLKKNFSHVKIGPTQPIGKVGYITIASVLVIYGIILYLAGII